jgi:hypothetical protein
MAPFIDIDFGSRLNALRSVGTALAVGNANIPDQTAANSQRTYIKYINLMRVQQGLPALTSLDYSGFTAAVNVLAARVA